jgi:predicted CoA-binding protein
LNTGKIITSDREIKEILENTKTIAVLGLSPKTERDSYKVGAYLKEKGYQIIPVRPGQKEILGEKAVKTLDDIEESRKPVDIVDAFRNSEQIPGHIPEALRLRPKVFWMQLGIENEKAAAQLTSAGIDVIMNRCIKIEYEKLFRKKIIV